MLKIKFSHNKPHPNVHLALQPACSTAVTRTHTYAPTADGYCRQAGGRGTYPAVPEELTVAAVTVLALLLVGGGGGAGAVLRAAVLVCTLVPVVLLRVIDAILAAVPFAVGVTAKPHTGLSASSPPPEALPLRTRGEQVQRAHGRTDTSQPGKAG